MILEAKSIFLLPGHLLYLFCNNDDDRRASGDFRTESINKLINTIICLLGFDLTEIKYNQVINRRGEIWRGLLYFSNGSFRRRRGAAALRRRRREGAILNYSCTRYSTQQAGSTITDDMTIARTMSMSTMSMSIMMATLRNRLPAQRAVLDGHNVLCARCSSRRSVEIEMVWMCRGRFPQKVNPSI